MNNAGSHLGARRTSYILSLWAEPQDDAPPVWRGSLEAANGRRIYFDSLGTLNRLLGESAGWRDPAASKEMDAVPPAG
jgi:hypothetical protein